MEIGSFLDELNKKRNSLKSQATVVTAVDGQKFIEKLTGNGEREIIKLNEYSFGFVVDEKPDLQVAEILSFLFLSSQDVVQDSNLLVQYGVTHILSIGIEIPIYVGNIVYKRIHLLDAPEADFLGVLKQSFDFIDKAREENKYNKVLVHCNAGYSRSPSIIIAYLMKSYGMSLNKAIELVKKKRDIHPNSGFMQQLKQFEAQLQK